MSGDITDISDPHQLIRYAAVARAELLRVHGLTQGELGRLMGKDPANFSRALKSGLPHDQLQELDRITVARIPDLTRGGGLTALALRLSPAPHLGVAVPASWTQDLLGRVADDEFEVLLQGWALLSVYQSVGTRHIHHRYREILSAMVERLIRIGASPVSPRSSEANALLGLLAGYAFDVVRNTLRDGLEKLPLGFRVWRAVTTIVQTGADYADLKEWVRLQVRHSNLARDRSVSPGSCFDLEAAVTIPRSWSPDHDDWIPEVLNARASNADATLDERSTAAHAMWERGASDHGRLKFDLERIIEQFEGESRQGLYDDLPEQQWIVATLKQNLRTGQGVCNSWPEHHDQGLDSVRRAIADVDDLPSKIVDDTRILIEHSLLQNSAVYRRHATETLSAGGWAGTAVLVYESILGNTSTPQWLRPRILSGFGGLQVSGLAVVRILEHEFDWAESAVGFSLNHEDDTDHRNYAVTFAHAVLVAIGDCFGAPESRSAVEYIYEHLESRLPGLLARIDGDQRYCLVERAAAYMLMMTAHSQPNYALEVLKGLRQSVDPVTRAISGWAMAGTGD